MQIKTDALVAELAKNVDHCFVDRDSRFKTLSKGHRMLMILLALAEYDLAIIVRAKNEKVWWRPSTRLRRYQGVRSHGLAMQDVFVEVPEHDTKTAKDLMSTLSQHVAEIEDGMFSLIRCFMMHMLGLLEYRATKDGLCEFHRTDRRVNVIDENGISHDFVDRYL